MSIRRVLHTQWVVPLFGGIYDGAGQLPCELLLGLLASHAVTPVQRRGAPRVVEGQASAGRTGHGIGRGVRQEVKDQLPAERDRDAAPAAAVTQRPQAVGVHEAAALAGVAANGLETGKGGGLLGPERLPPRSAEVLRAVDVGERVHGPLQRNRHDLHLGVHRVGVLHGHVALERHAALPGLQTEVEQAVDELLHVLQHGAGRGGGAAVVVDGGDEAVGGGDGPLCDGDVALSNIDSAARPPTCSETKATMWSSQAALERQNQQASSLGAPRLAVACCGGKPPFHRLIFSVQPPHSSFSSAFTAAAASSGRLNNTNLRSMSARNVDLRLGGGARVLARDHSAASHPAEVAHDPLQRHLVDLRGHVVNPHDAAGFGVSKDVGGCGRLPFGGGGRRFGELRRHRSRRLLETLGRTWSI
ncbi:acyl-CoA dehydrogenase [Babesia caballi]|uniref:Acyl-CoA dehydrogenase n=1 Tax=Babesia caballi TaxID=5871 RepID=A0AAV4LTG9_BABCB|nr:acyl-CoA dehydrogenase [Babesia caballi]